MSTPFIQVQRAIELVPNFDSSDTSTLQDIVSASCGLVEKYLNRTLAVTAYDELLDGTGHPNLLLSQYPITQIQRVLFCPTQVLSIGNNKASVSRASFRLDATNLYLECVDSGVVATHTIALSSCPMLNDLAAAINAFSSEGWQSTALGIYGTWRTLDLYTPQGGQEVRWIGFGYIWHHTIGVPAVMQNDAIGEIVSTVQFQRGYQNYRVLYSAGFPVIPYEIQQATAELAAATYLQREVNPNLQSENLGGYSYSNIAQKTFDNLSIASKYSLSQYRNLRIGKFRVG